MGGDVDPGHLAAETPRLGGSWRGPGCSERGQGARCQAAAERGSPGARSGARLRSSEPASRSPARLCACWGQGRGGGLRAAQKATLWEAEEPRELQEPPLVAVRPRCSSWVARLTSEINQLRGPGRPEAAGAGALGTRRGRLQTFLGVCASQAPSPWSFVPEDPAAVPRFPDERPHAPPCLRVSGRGAPTPTPRWVPGAAMRAASGPGRRLQWREGLEQRGWRRGHLLLRSPESTTVGAGCAPAAGAGVAADWLSSGAGCFSLQSRG